jgi:hypothetical protein
MKVVHLVEGHKFHVDWNFKFWVEIGEKLDGLAVPPVSQTRPTFNVGTTFLQNLSRKHPIAFLKVVEGNEIYNFPIDRNVHFSSRFWSYTRPNQGTAKRVGRSAPHRAAARRRVSRLRRACATRASASGPRTHVGTT